MHIEMTDHNVFKRPSMVYGVKTQLKDWEEYLLFRPFLL